LILEIRKAILLLMPLLFSINCSFIYLLLVSRFRSIAFCNPL
jgi:hypothetical protein